MNRRKFLTHTGCFAGLILSERTLSARVGMLDASRPIDVSLDPQRPLGRIPSNYLGLGYETSSLARTGLLSVDNHVYIQLLRTLGARGVIRIGGNTSDYSAFRQEMKAVSSPRATVINNAVIRDLGKFLEVTGWDLIWGLNLGNGTKDDAVSEARAISANCNRKLLAFEIGNEPDLFSHEGHRRPPYTYSDFLAEYRTFHHAIRNALPHAPFAGPDVASATDWVTAFAQDEGSDLKLLTHHYYREGQNPGSTIDKLLSVDPKLKPLLTKLKAASVQSGLPYRLCEMNSFSGGGKPGVSDTFASALWILDFMHNLASEGGAGVNVETGVNQLGFISSYSPIGDDEHGNYVAKPIFYGMLAFSQVCGSQRIPVTCGAGGTNFSAYASRMAEDHVILTLINKDLSIPASARISSTVPIAKASVMRLTGSSITSATEVTFGGSTVSAEGRWEPTQTESPQVRNGAAVITVPAASAAVVKLVL